MTQANNATVKNKDKVKFEDIVLSQSGFNVLPLTDSIISDLAPFVEQAIKNYNTGPRWKKRVNEFGNHMEEVLRNTDPTRFTKPTNAKGKKQATGYPDLKFVSNQIVVYPEIKILKQGSTDNAMRSFYVSTFGKITSDAVHVVIGFEHVDMKLTGNYHIVDMKNKTLTVKIEFACSNLELYK
jgi:hypothetical protein